MTNTSGRRTNTIAPTVPMLDLDGRAVPAAATADGELKVGGDLVEAIKAALEEPGVVMTFGAVTTVAGVVTAPEVDFSGDFPLLTWLIKAQGVDGTCTTVIVTPEFSVDGTTWIPGTAFATLSNVTVATPQYQVATTAYPCKYFRFSVAAAAFQVVVTVKCFGLPR